MDTRIQELSHDQDHTEFDPEALESKLQRNLDDGLDKMGDLLKRYLETQRTLQLQMKELSVTVKRMELVERRTISPNKGNETGHERANSAGRGQLSAGDEMASPRFPIAETVSPVQKRSTSVPHVRKSKSPKSRSVSSSSTPEQASTSPVHASTAKSRAMEASIKKKLKEIKVKEQAQKVPKQSEVKPKRQHRLEARRNDRLDQLYKEYTAKYQAPSS
jgi:hypothetical protein